MHEVITNNLDLWTSVLLTKSSAGRSSNGKQEVYGIKKLRQLILELAVRGKLVPQSPKDEPAIKLLERVFAEKARMVKEGKIRKERDFLVIADGEATFGLPAGWEWARLGILAEIVRGVSYKKHEAQDSEFEEGIALMRANNIGDVLNFDSLVYVPKILVSEEQLLTTGDLLIAMSSGSADLVGKAAQVKSEVVATFGAFCGVVRPISAELWDFLGLFFKTPLYRAQAAESSKGIGINNLNKAALENFLVVIPPLDEQHRIVAKVDELMALCDQLEQQQTYSIKAHQTLIAILLGALTRVVSQQELREAWVRIAAHFDTLFTTEESIDQLKQAILQLAVMGKLVPQDPNDEPASELITKINAEKQRLINEGTIKEASALPTIELAEMSFKVPERWKWERLGNIGLIGSSSRVHQKDWKDRGIPFYRAREIVQLSKYGFVDNELFITEELYQALASHGLTPEPGDVMLTGVGTIGVPYVVKEGDSFYFKDASVIIFKNCFKIFPLFLRYFFESSLWFKEIHKDSMGTTVDTLTISRANLVPIPLPSISEQRRIVAKVDELMALCDALKARIKDAQSTQIHLADAIVEQAVA